MKKILVVDDSKVIQRIFVEYLKSSGYEAVTANNGKEAVEKVQNEPFDLILMDLMMPVMDGFKAILRIREIKSLPFIPIIVISSIEKPDDLKKALKLGANEYVFKPIDEVAFNARVQAMFRLKYFYDKGKSSEQKYETLLQSLPDVVYKLDMKGHFVFISDSVKSLGFNPHELIGRHFSEIVHPDDVPFVSSSMVLSKYAGKETDDKSTPKLFDERRSKERATKNLEVRLVPKERSEKKVDSDGLNVMVTIAFGEVVSAGQYDSKSNEMLGTVGVIRDITERKQAEEEKRKLNNELAGSLQKLKESESDYRNLVQNVNSIILRMTPEGKVKYFNRFAENFFGYSAEKIIGENVVGSIVPEKDKEGKNLRALLEDIGKNPGKYIYNENENVLNNGRRVWISWTNKGIVGIDGKTREILCVGHDVTHLKENEYRLKKAKLVAEEATKLKDKFVSLVSHDLKAPLKSAIEQLAWFHTDRTTNVKGIQSIEAVEKAKAILEGLLRMIEKLLDLSLLQTGKIEPVKRSIDIRSLVEEKINNLSLLAQKKGIEVINKLPEDSRIVADPVLIGEVMQNIFFNAIKFCDRGNRITFFMPVKNTATIVVKDNGKGIKQSMIADIFKHEIRTTSIGTAGEIGTGIGLPYSKDIMEAHEGTIAVESTEGKGSSFSITFPNHELLILIADDEKVQRLILKELLKKIMKVEILEAENGRELIEVLEEATPDLIITDINMPVMDGCEAVKAIRENERKRGGHIPIIIVSSLANIESIQKHLKNGADEFLSKPLDLDNLLQKINKLLGTSCKKESIIENTLEPEISNKGELFNIEPLREKLNYDENKITEMLNWIFEDTAHQIEEISQAVNEGLNKQVIFAAHRAKNSAVQIEAVKLTDIFHNIEQMGEKGKLETVPEQLENAKKIFEEIRNYIQKTEDRRQRREV